MIIIIVTVTMAKNLEHHQGLVGQWASVGKGGKGHVRGPPEALMCGPRLEAVPGPPTRPPSNLPSGRTPGLPSSSPAVWGLTREKLRPGWDAGGGEGTSVTKSFLREGRNDLPWLRTPSPPPWGNLCPWRLGHSRRCQSFLERRAELGLGGRG